MNWTALVERLARALSVWWDGPDQAVPGKWTLSLDPGVGLKFRLWRQGNVVNEAVSRPEDVRVLDPADALVLLLAYARDLRLDVGACRTCAGSKVNVWWRRDQPGETPTADRRMLNPCYGPLKHREHRKWVGPCLACNGPGPDVECEACGGSGESKEWPSNSDEFGWSLVNTTVSQDGSVYMPCGTCRGKGHIPGPPQPTGRDIRKPQQWVLTLASEPVCIIDDTMSVDERARRKRESDAELADQTSVRETASVLADRLQSRGDALGTVLVAWLRGECQVLGCAESGAEVGQSGQSGWPSCPGCRGLGQVLGAPGVEIERLVKAVCEPLECPMCEGSGTSPAQSALSCQAPCQICGGDGLRNSA